MRWHSSAKPVRTKNPRSLLACYVQKNNQGRKKSTCKRTVLEVYSDLYYDSKLCDKVKEEIEKDSAYASLSQSEHLTRHMVVYCKICTKSWANESDDVKAEVQKIYDQEHQGKVDSSLDEEDDENEDDENDEKTAVYTPPPL